MNRGILKIRFPDGTSSDFPVQAEVFNVGRAPDNDLVINHPSVSRKHARLKIEGETLIIEDLDSANGSFLGTSPIPANTPTAVPKGARLVLGEVSLEYMPPAPVSEVMHEPTVMAPRPAAPRPEAPPPAPPPPQPRPTSPPAQPPAPAAPPPPQRTIGLKLTGPDDPVVPGNTTIAQLTVQNLGSIVDEVRIRVTGVPEDWVRLNKESLRLLPNAQEQVIITFQPPRRFNAVAWTYPFEVVATSREYHTGETVKGNLTVLSFVDFNMELKPVRARRDFSLVARNMGNTPVTYSLFAMDDEAALDYSLSQPSVTLRPGQIETVHLRVTPRRGFRSGGRQYLPFTVIARPGQEGKEVKTTGQLSLKLGIPAWLISILILLLAAVVVGAGAAYTRLCPTYWPEGPFCPAGARPVINAFIASAEEVEPGTTVTLGWDVSGADQVQISGPVQNTVAGTATMTYVVTSPVTFTLRATNFAGTVEQSIAIMIKGEAPLIKSFTSDPGAIIRGQNDKVLLSWAVEGVSTVSIIGVPQQNLSPVGSVEVSAPDSNVTYTLVAKNDYGEASQELVLVVSDAGCIIANPTDATEALREGPHSSHPEIVILTNGEAVEPVGRNSTITWLLVRARNKEGWVVADHVSCAAGSFATFPTINPANIPTPVPTATASITPTPSITPSALPVLPGMIIRTKFVGPIYIIPSSTPTP